MIKCDNAAVCGQTYEFDEPEWAVAKGWRIWVGTTMGGGEHRAVLCPVCARPARGARRPPVRRDVVPEGTVELFALPGHRVPGVNSL